MIHELATPIESATHVKVEQVDENWTTERWEMRDSGPEKLTGTPTIHALVTFGTMQEETVTEDGEEKTVQVFVPIPVLKSGWVRLYAHERGGFDSWLVNEKGVPADVVGEGGFRRHDLCEYFDQEGLWTRVD